MSTISAGKVEATNLTVQGLGAGAIQATNLDFNNLNISNLNADNLTVPQPVDCSFIRNINFDDNVTSQTLGIKSSSKTNTLIGHTNEFTKVPLPTHETVIDCRLPYDVLFNGGHSTYTGLDVSNNVIKTTLSELLGSNMQILPSHSGVDASGNINRFEVIEDPEEPGKYIIASKPGDLGSAWNMFAPPLPEATYTSNVSFSKGPCLNTFLSTKRKYKNFVLKFEYRNEYDPVTKTAKLSDSGVLIRSNIYEGLTADFSGFIPGFVPSNEELLSGPQFDCVGGAFTKLFDFCGNQILPEGAGNIQGMPVYRDVSGTEFGIYSASLKKLQYINSDSTLSNLGWNKVTICCKDQYYYAWVNGELQFAYYDPIDYFQEGYIGIQSHIPMINYGWGTNMAEWGNTYFKNVIVQERDVNFGLPHSSGIFS
jgi:hypothetical protein